MTGHRPWRDLLALTKRLKHENGNALKNWRVAVTATQSEAAAWYGVSERTWRRYERGESRVPTPLIRRIESGAIKEFLKRERSK